PVTKSLASAMSLGCADIGLSMAVECARTQQRFKKTVLELAYPRRLLARAFATLLACEAAVVGAVRTLHLNPSGASGPAAVTKYFVPRSIERVLLDLSEVLGARSYLRSGHPFGLFQKAMRDCAFPRIGHYAPATSLQHIALHLRTMLRRPDAASGS